MHEKAISGCLIARFISIDRYCKLAMQRATGSEVETAQFTLPEDISSILDASMKQYKEINGFSPYIVGHYVIRFRIDEEIYITFKLVSQTHIFFLELHNCTHFMVSKRRRLIWGYQMVFSVDCKSYKISQNFPWTSCSSKTTRKCGITQLVAKFSIQLVIIPYLRASTRHGKKLFVTRKGGYPFSLDTFAAGGNSAIQVVASDGKPLITGEFSVLCLRHDPSDIQPPYPNAPNGAMDPTGPPILANILAEEISRIPQRI